MPSFTSRRRASTIAILVSTALAITGSPALGAGKHSIGHGRTRRAAVCANANTPASSAPRAALKAAVACLINRQRAAHGLPALREDSRLNRSAQIWSDTMATTQQFDHGEDFAARITAAGYIWSTAGENIATGFATPQQVVSVWMGSPEHCRNILDPDYLSVGTGIVDRAIPRFSSAAATWTQDFALPMGAPAPSSNWGPADSVC
jgi:uncharacterized protein YkwD